MHITRRLILGVIIGLASAGLIMAIVRAGPDFSGSGLEGAFGLLAAGIVIGGSYALLFEPVRGGHAESMMNGLVLGLFAWVVLSINVFPGLTGRSPMWGAATAASLFPQLIFHLLQGIFIGLIYGLAYEALAERLRLAAPDPARSAPAIATRVVILGGGYAGVSDPSVRTGISS